MNARLVCTLLLLGTAAALRADDEIEYLVPEMKGNSFALSDGERPFLHRLAFTPAFGRLGDENYYSLRLAYAPNPWLGYEAHIGHNPSESVHALMHSVHAVLRWPFSGRFQPYGTLGYGMMLIFPGEVFKADPVTKNALSAGAGLEFYLRDDVALRTEIRGIALLGGNHGASDDDGYSYRELSVGLAFYRTLNP
jgi:hypothetical protein